MQYVPRSYLPVTFNNGLGLLLGVDKTPIVSQKSVGDHRGFIISIGPETDAVLHHLGLDDSLVLDLRGMARTVRSSQWAATLRSPEWGLTHDQAANLSTALLADIQANPTALIIKVSSAFNL